MTQRDTFNREAATIAEEASDDAIAQQIAAITARRARTRATITSSQKRKARDVLRRAAWGAAVGALLATMGACAFLMNTSHGYL